MLIGLMVVIVSGVVFSYFSDCDNTFFCNRYIDTRYAVVSIDRNCRLFWQEEVDPVVLPFVQLWLFVTERQCIIVRI